MQIGEYLRHLYSGLPCPTSEVVRTGGTLYQVPIRGSDICKIPGCMSSRNWNSRYSFCASRFIFVFFCFFLHRAHLPRRHPGRACPAASSRARAVGIGAEICHIVGTSTRWSFSKHETLFPEGARNRRHDAGPLF